MVYLELEQQQQGGGGGRRNSKASPNHQSHGGGGAAEEAREEGGRIRDELVHSSKMSYKVKDVVPLRGQVLLDFIAGILSPKHNPK